MRKNFRKGKDVDARVIQAIKDLVAQLHKGEITNQECTDKIVLLNNIYNNKTFKE